MTHIIVIDDQLAILRDLSSFLQYAGYPVSAFANPADALTFTRNRPIDIAIIDTQIISMDAEVLAEKLHQQHPDIKIIAMSGRRNLQLITVDGVLQNVQTVVSEKSLLIPYSREELLHAICEIVNNPYPPVTEREYLFAKDSPEL